jgi:hypothetical protein
MKRRYGFTLLISAGLAFCSLGGYIADMPTVMWGFVAFALLCLMSIRKEAMWIDTTKNEIVLTRGLIVQQTTIPLANIRHFEVARVMHDLINVNTSLSVWYYCDGKANVAMISHGFTARAMQNRLNEIDEIIRQCKEPENSIAA